VGGQSRRLVHDHQVIVGVQHGKWDIGRGRGHDPVLHGGCDFDNLTLAKVQTLFARSPGD
jgi:hypothetical protein